MLELYFHIIYQHIFFRYKKKNLVEATAGCCQPKKKKDYSDSFTPEPMLHAFVGFLRLANFISAATVIFGLVTEKIFTWETKESELPPTFLNDITKNPGFMEVTNYVKF